MPFLFEKLDVYNLSIEFNNKIVELCKSRAFRGYRYLEDQLKRASLSISLNIAEGNGRFHKNDRRTFFLIARGSAFECVPIIKLCEINKIVTEEDTKILRDYIERISKMLSGLIVGAEKRGL